MQFIYLFERKNAMIKTLKIRALDPMCTNIANMQFTGTAASTESDALYKNCLYGENRFRIECYRPLKIESLEELMINTPHKCFNVNIVKSIWTMGQELHGWYSCIVWIVAPTESKEKGNRHENTLFIRFFFSFKFIPLNAVLNVLFITGWKIYIW